MTKKLLFVFTILLVVAFVAMAADVTGKWVYEQAGRGGGNPTQVTLNLKANGSTLTGSMVRPGRGGDPMESAISEGKIDGDNISFATVMSRDGNEFKMLYTGKIDGDTIKFTRQFGAAGDRPAQQFTATRVK